VAIPALSPADSANVVAQVYGTSLLALLPVVAAGLAALALRGAPARVRVLIWRSAVGALAGAALLRILGGGLALPFTAWAVPAVLASPLVALGRAQVSTTPAGGVDQGLPALLLLLYVAGVAVALLRLARAVAPLRAVVGRAEPAPREWLDALERCRARLGVQRPVRLVVSPDLPVPVTWGTWRPIIVVPVAAIGWLPLHRDAVLLHELSHVRSADALVQLAARLLCALLWFHPAIWWVAARLRAECELACDERVVASGIRRSDYAELLAMAADELRGRRVVPQVAPAMSSRAGLRARLAAIMVSEGRALATARGPGRAHVAVAAALAVAVALPTGLAQLSPTRKVLDGLLRDARWESRAYAVTRLAQRADTLAVARDAASRDPDPQVRAVAARALARRGVASSSPPAHR